MTHSENDDRAVAARYSRQALFPGLTADGQRALARSTVVLVGCGGLGCTQATLLVRAGVGHVRLIDPDVVDESNLQRQLLFDESDARARRPKATTAAEKLHEVNSLVQVEGLVDEVSSASAERLLAGADVILDASDNLGTRYLLNDFAVSTGTPWVYGACAGSSGMTFTILPDDTPCLRCVFPEVPSVGVLGAETVGVLGAIVVVVASLQVAEALKIASGRPQAVNRHMATVDVWTNRLEMIELLGREPTCPCCGRRDFPFLTAR